MASRAQDWFRQGENDLEQAKDSHEAGRYEWACFAAQQAAEKGVKGLHLSLGQEAWGHVIAKLLRELPTDVFVPDDLVDKARVLDNFYIPSRYPNSHPEGPPFEHFGPLQSQAGIDHARAILNFVRDEMAGSSHRP